MTCAPRVVVLATDQDDALAYLRAHRDVNVAILDVDDLRGLAICEVRETELFAALPDTDDNARTLRLAAASRTCRCDARRTPPAPAAAAAPDPLVDRFRHHPPANQATIDAHQDVRASALALAQRIEKVAPDGREKATALTKCEEAMMWANAAIARGGAR